MRPGARRATTFAVATSLLVGACSSGAADPSATVSAEDASPVPDDVETNGDDTDDGDGTDAGDAGPVDLADAVVATEPPLPLTPVPASRDALSDTLDEVLAEAEEAAPDAQFGVHVVDEAGREVAALAPDRPLLPASTMKIVTAAAVLTTFGRDARLTTVVDATSGIGPDGVVDGDLVLVGAGDPTLATDDYGEFVYPARPRTSLAALADQLVAAGVTEVTGAIRGVAPRFAGDPLPTGWRDGYLASFDGRYITGLTVDGGLRTVVTYPEPEDEGDEGDDDGDEGDEDAAPADPAATDPPLAPEDVEAAGDDAEEDLGPPDVRIELAQDPVAHAAAELRRLLDERDVTVAGKATTGPSEDAITARLATVRSDPLVELLRFAVRRSDNHLADQLFKLVGRRRTGVGSWESGARALRQVLDRFGIEHDEARFADGSGLSRDDRLTAGLLVDLDRTMTSDLRFGADWRTLQAVTGRSGTLERRLVGTPAAGRFLGKTGTLRDVTALVGQVITADADPTGGAGPGERRYHLAVLVNDADAGDRAVARAVMDETILALVADLDGCALQPAGEDDGPLGRPPSAVAC